jgi:hypothetical protein
MGVDERLGYARQPLVIILMRRLDWYIGVTLLGERGWE